MKHPAGWAPQSFTSSRKNRAEVKQQSILNFLDEDEKAVCFASFYQLYSHMHLMKNNMIQCGSTMLSLYGIAIVVCYVIINF